MFAALLLSLPTVMSANGSQSDSPTRIQLTDLARLQQVVAIESATDGSKSVAAVRGVYGDPSDREAECGYRTQLHLIVPNKNSVDRDGTEQDAVVRVSQLTHTDAGAASPAISPDGQQLAFVRTGEGEDEERGGGKPQVWILPLDAPGEARQLTHVKHGARNPRWLPHGGALIVDSGVPADELEGESPYDRERSGRTGRTSIDEAQPEPDAEAHDQDSKSEAPTIDPNGGGDALRRWLDAGKDERAPTVTHRIAFQDEHGLRGPAKVTQLLRVDAAEGDAEALTKGFVDVGNGRLSPDGRQLLFTARAPSERHPDRVLRSSIWILDLAGGPPRTFFDDAAYDVNSAIWSSDGQSIFATLSDASEPTFALSRLVSFAPGASEPSFLADDIDADVSDLSEAGGVLIFRTEFEGRDRLHGFDLESRTHRELIDRNGSVLDYALSSDGTVMYAFSESANPCEVYRLDAATDDVRCTDLHTTWLQGVELSMPIERWVEREDGSRVQWWALPPLGLEEGAAAPTVLEMHGGPHVMWGSGEYSMWHEFQLLAARGYAVVFANPRGSSGYGYAFRKGNFQDWGSGPMSDVLAALDAAAAQLPFVDTQRLFLTGGSYAGYLTAWIVAHDNRFKAAVAQRGVYDLATFFGEGNAWRLVEWSFGGMPWELDTRALLTEQSPFAHVASIETPLLIMHASSDLRTGVSQSEMLYRGLKELERPVEYVRYPDAGHDLSRTGHPRQRLDRLGRILEYFSRFGGA